MKKVLLVLLCTLSAIAMNAMDSGKNITITKGQTIVLDLASDIGIVLNYPHTYIYSQKGGSGHYNELYTESDATALSIIPIEHIYSSSFGGKYYTFQITPQKTGSYTLYQEFSLVQNSSYGSNNSFTYNINVVDVVNIIIPSTLSMFVGEEQQITPTIIQMGAATTLTWQSSNTSVATVSSDGTITAIKQGSTTITCTAHNGVFAQCEVTVNPVLVSGITLNETNSELTVGEKLQMSATIAPDNATVRSVTWSSTNEAVAVVDETGLVTAVGSGTCQIKATANDGSGKTASCLITVEKNNKLTVTDMTQCSGGRGVLNVLLSDEETIMGFQFDLQLPAGVTVAENNGKLMAALTGNAVNTHSISSSKVSDGLYRFVVTPQGSRAISNANGDGMTITIDVADEMATGVYDMTIKDIEMTVRKAGYVYEDIHPKNSTAKLTVTEAVMGDVNGDGRVSVTDVISMNSYILEEEPAQFIRKVADLNGDGKVTITDIVLVIDIILGR